MLKADLLDFGKKVSGEERRLREARMIESPTFQMALSDLLQATTLVQASHAGADN
jgi:hypothetical protein